MLSRTRQMSFLITAYLMVAAAIWVNVFGAQSLKSWVGFIAGLVALALSTYVCLRSDLSLIPIALSASAAAVASGAAGLATVGAVLALAILASSWALESRVH